MGASKAAEFMPAERVEEVLEQVLASSPADETELVWFERRVGRVTQGSRGGGDQDRLEVPRLTVLVRAVEGQRQGWYRTEVPLGNELESGLRQALALAKVQPKARKRPLLPAKAEEIAPSPNLVDPAIDGLTLGDARRHLGSWCGEDVRGELQWSSTRLAVFNSHGLRRRARTTEVSLRVTAGEGPGEGLGGASARSLEALRAPAVVERALRWRGSGTPAPIPERPVPLLLAPEAVAELLNLLNMFAFAGRAYLDGTSFLTRHRGIQVFDRGFGLRDDGTRTPGMPFPFDLEGSAKRPLDLIVEGQPSTPALNLFQGGEAGLEPTAQSVGGQDAFFGNLFLLPGGAGEEDLLAAADGGLRIGWLETPECYDPTQLEVRVKARGVRRIEGGRPGPPVADLVWEDSLLRSLARLKAVGDDPVVRAMPSTPLGGITTPSLVLAEAGDLGPAPSS
ncbi:MAG: metallopeptidase TldD-related protein [Acidobacteriota bacterium]